MKKVIFISLLFLVYLCLFSNLALAQKSQIFEGKSAKGDFQEALSNAINKAAKSSGIPDNLVTWKLRKVTGESGGIAVLNNITVRIEARFSSDTKR